jgi:GAF domain-containing protein
MVAPILQEVRSSESHRGVAPGPTNKLWGVLVVHACPEKRVWQESEAQLLQQIANQLAIAVQQASLFEQLQQELYVPEFTPCCELSTSMTTCKAYSNCGKIWLKW